VVHQTLDPLIVAGTWLAAGGVVYGAVKSLKRLRKSRTAELPSHVEQDPCRASFNAAALHHGHRG
jgi:hypothetical protein